MNPLVLFPIEHHLALPPRTVAFCRFEHAKRISLDSVAIVLPKRYARRSRQPALCAPEHVQKVRKLARLVLSERLRASLPKTGALHSEHVKRVRKLARRSSDRMLTDIAPENRRFALPIMSKEFVRSLGTNDAPGAQHLCSKRRNWGFPPQSPISIDPIIPSSIETLLPDANRLFFLSVEVSALQSRALLRKYPFPNNRSCARSSVRQLRDKRGADLMTGFRGHARNSKCREWSKQLRMIRDRSRISKPRI